MVRENKLLPRLTSNGLDEIKRDISPARDLEIHTTRLFLFD
jgi:hypothetical protein